MFLEFVLMEKHLDIVSYDLFSGIVSSSFH